ncbi:MAG TPA: Gfo/Idh/MocA family oxidoreductase [Candidatus Acidoferrales bacterium]|nr:Gfo/Idh/MocA family oxidoreductase [Candidatus Acidoferrales bacterium]
MIRVSFVGCGGMAAQYLPVYKSLDWVQLVNCIDPALGVSDYSLALAPEIDAIVINTPNHLHRPQAVAAIEAGKHVLLQKPVAPAIKDAEAIQAAAEKSTRTVGLYMSYFDQPLIHDLRDMIGEGRLGNIVHCYARLMHKGGMMWSDAALKGNRNWRGSVAETGGGCFIQLAVHYIHIFEWVTGARIVKASGFQRNLHCPGLEGEDLALGVFEFDSGAMATIDTAWCANGEELAIHGTEGRCVYRENRLAVSSTRGPFAGRVVRYSGGLVDAFGGPQGEEQALEIKPPGFADTTNPLNQHVQFLEAVRDGRPAPVSIASGVHDLRVVDALYRSAREGRAVEVA